MKQFRLKSELIWMKKETGIEIYHGNNRLNMLINTDDNDAFFHFCSLLVP